VEDSPKAYGPSGARERPTSAVQRTARTKVRENAAQPSAMRSIQVVFAAIAPAIRLLAGCCMLVGPSTAWGQRSATDSAVAPIAPSGTSDTTTDVPAAATATPALAPGVPPLAAESAARTSKVEVLDTWGTSNPEVAPTEPATLSPESAAATSEPSRTTASRSTAPDSDDASHLRYYLERIEVRGNTLTRSSVIIRYLPFREGKQLDVDDAEFTLARYRLLGTGFFREVEFSLRKGSKRGNVVLVVDVVERNTVVVNGVWMGLSKNADTNGDPKPLTAYLGFDVAETNLAGSGISLGGAVGLAQDQLAVRVRFLDPAFLGTPWMVNLTLLHNRATDFFGTQGVVWDVPNDATTTKYAVVPYKRFGGSVGIGRDLSMSTQLWFHYRLETISADVPSYALQNRGGKIEPIQFDIIQGRSVFSSARANFQFDTRDHPFLPTRGWLVTTWGELGLLPLGSDYNFQRFDIASSYWWHKKNSPHVFRLQLFAGAMAGDVPFFEQYYVGDFSEFLPARMLSLNVDRRPSPDILNLKTAIREVRYGQYAAQIAGEYRFPVYRGHRSVYGIDLFLRAGFFSVADRRNLIDPAPNYHGFRRIPLDFTFNTGFRMDTSAGGIVFSLSNVLSFLPPFGGKQ
jgi:outer membrane protein insertion porin family